MSDITEQTYQEKEGWDIIKHEVEAAIRHLATKKASGPDEIPSQVIKAALPVLTDPLLWLYNQCISAGYYLKHFRNFITVVLRKIGKGDYSIPKHYQPIALLIIVGKVLESILATRMGFMADKHDMLLKGHMWGRRGMGVEKALHTLTDKIHANRAKKLVTTALFLDVFGAYDNVSHQRLLHNLCKRGMNEIIVKFIDSFMTDRQTDVRLSDFLLKGHKIGASVPQGSLFSPILYLFYNADLLKMTTIPGLFSSIIRYVNDVCIIVTGKSAEENVRKLAKVHLQAAL